MDDLVSAWKSTDVVHVGLDESLRAVRDLMLEQGIHHVAVHDDGRLMGVVSDRDVLAEVSPVATKEYATERDLWTLEKRVHRIMSRRPVTIRDDDAMETAVETMLAHRIHCLPVVDARGACTGMLTVSDVLRWSIRAPRASAEAAA